MAQITRGNENRREPVGEAPETQVVDRWRVACDGSEGALGHPRVWLQIPEDLGWVECGYCDKRFIHESSADGGGADLPGRDGPDKAHPGVP